VKLASEDVQGARAAFDTAIANARVLASEDATSSRHSRDLAIALQRQGNLGVATKDAGLATSMYGECLGIFEKLAALDPGNIEWSHDIAITRFKLGQAAAVEGDGEAALRHFKRALRERRTLLEASPENHRLRIDIAENLMELAKVADAVEGREALEEARSILRELEARRQVGKQEQTWLRSIDTSLGDSARR
jgi:tetratricopeptide (TPR) repeat protein